MGNSSCKRDVERRKQAGKNCAAACMDNVALPTLLTSNSNVKRQREKAKAKFDDSFLDHSFALRSRAASDIRKVKPEPTVSTSPNNQQENFPRSVSDQTGYATGSALDHEEHFHRSLTAHTSSELTNGEQQKFHRSLSVAMGYTYVGSRCVAVGIDKQATFGLGLSGVAESEAKRKAQSGSSDSMDSDENEKRVRGPGWFQAKRTHIKRPGSNKAWSSIRVVT